MVIKGISSARGEQVFLCENQDQLLKVPEDNAALEVIAQEFIPTSYGKDVRVYIVDKKPIDAIQRSSQDTFRANIAQGGVGTPFEMSPYVYELSCKVAEAFEFEVGGIDLLFGENEDEFYLTELNIFTLFYPVEDVTNINIAGPILEMIQRKKTNILH